MQKKLLAVAVAGALAVPSAALAASSVTITGFFKLSWAYVKVKPQTVGENSQDRIQDESSRIYFRVVEDLGGGLQAVGQIDWRIQLDAGSDGTSGANWVGLRSKSWGELTIGRHDLHYIYTEDQSYSRGGSLKMTNTSLIAYSNAGANPVANASRTPNTIRWASPNWNGFTIVGAYSSSPYDTEADIGSSVRDGYAWHVAPQYNAKNWGIGYSYYNGKSDGGVSGLSLPMGGAVVAGCSATGACSTGTLGAALGVAATALPIEGTSHRVNGHYQWGGFRVGVVWDRSEWKDDGTLTGPAALGSKFSKRDAWSIPARYSWGKWNVFGHYTWADKDKGSWYTNLPSNNTKSKMWAIGGSYEFSKRTSIAISYADIDNDSEARYNLFTSAGGLGSADAKTNPGQDPSQFAVTVTHSF